MLVVYTGVQKVFVPVRERGYTHYLTVGFLCMMDLVLTAVWQSVPGLCFAGGCEHQLCACQYLLLDSSVFHNRIQKCCIYIHLSPQGVASEPGD